MMLFEVQLGNIRVIYLISLQKLISHNQLFPVDFNRDSYLYYDIYYFSDFKPVQTYSMINLIMYLCSHDSTHSFSKILTVVRLPGKSILTDFVF